MNQARESFPIRFGEFALLASLGAGGMGRAYLAAHRDWPDLVVLKRMHAHFQEDAEVFRRFLHEAKTATHVRHPAVAGAIAVGTVGTEPFFATEYVFGLPLSRLVERMESGALPPPPLGVGLYLALDLVKGLEAIHEAVDRDTGAPLQLLHRDIGSRNALVGFDGRLRIIDLGLGRSLLSDWVTAADTVAGSPDYMSPEQATGERVDRRADVYAAAVTIFELLAGKKRIRAETVAERLHLAVTARPEALRRHRDDVSSALEAALAAAMAPEPGARTPHVRILGRALEAELWALPDQTRRADAAAWLAEHAASDRAVMDAQRREAERLANTLLSGPVEETRIHAALPPPRSALADPFEHELEDATTPRAQVAAAEPRRRPAPMWLRPAAVALAALLLLVVGGLSWRMLWSVAARGADPRVEPAFEALGFEAESSPPGSSPGQAEASPVEETPESEASPEDGAPAEHEAAPTESAAKSRPKPLPPALAGRKRALAARLQGLRRSRFDVAYQRQLTQVGQSLSRARAPSELDEVERRIKRLEDER